MFLEDSGEEGRRKQQKNIKYSLRSHMAIQPRSFVKEHEQKKIGGKHLSQENYIPVCGHKEDCNPEGKNNTEKIENLKKSTMSADL